MQRPITFLFGIGLFVVGLLVRFNIGRIFFAGSFTWSGNAFEVSRDGLRLHALIDVWNIIILTGIAIALIGWFYPKKP